MDLDGHLALVVEAKAPRSVWDDIPFIGLFGDALILLMKGTTSTELVGTFKDPEIRIRPFPFLSGGDPELPPRKKPEATPGSVSPGTSPDATSGGPPPATDPRK